MQTFATPAPITAILDVPAGRIQVTAAGRADTTVELRPADPAKGRDVKLAEQTTAEYRDGVLRITAPAGNRVFGSSGAVELTVQLPAGSRVEAKAASAQFTTAGQLGDVTTLGRIHNALKNTDGTPGLNIHATTTVGDITARSL